MKNRSEYLARQLKYYAKQECGHTVYIGDSSEGHHLERAQEAIHKCGERIRVVYLQLPGQNPYQVIDELSQRVEEPYVALASDDNFLVPGSLEKCAGFLDDHPEYESAHGIAISFAVQSDLPSGEMVRSEECPQRAAEKTSAASRLLELFPSSSELGSFTSSFRAKTLIR